MNTNCLRHALIGCSLWLSACASIPSGPAAEGYVLRLAQQRVDAIAAANYAKAYSFTTPGYQTGTSVDVYAIRIGISPVRWIAGQALKASCEKDLCKVDVRVTFELRKPVPRAGKIGAATVVHERWIRGVKGWRYLPER